MPIYEYRCRNCDRRFEVIKRMGDDKLPPCVACASKNVERLISATGFILKGGGWYVTDYPSQARKEGVAKDKATGGETSAAKPAAAEGGAAKAIKPGKEPKAISPARESKALKP